MDLMDAIQMTVKDNQPKVLDEVIGYVMSFRLKGIKRRYLPMHTAIVRVYQTHLGEVRIEAPPKIIKEIFNRVEQN